MASLSPARRRRPFTSPPTALSVTNARLINEPEPPFGIGLAAGSTVVADAGERLICAVTADAGQAIGRGPVISVLVARLQDSAGTHAVRADLTSTVHRAPGPAHVSLWLGRMPR